MSDAIRRGVRTFVDVAFVTAVVQALVEFGVELTAGQRASIIALGTFLVSAVKNALEDAGSIPAVLKAPASDGDHPVPADAGVTALEAAAISFLVCLVVLLILT